MDDIVFIGDWIKDRVLGSGSFGTVVLWKHKRSDERLAIKTCKWGDELTAKHKERWTKEVEMLQNCDNPNIVGTKELPPEFVSGLAKANPSKLPILCMEYCSGGDLRQMLNKPESCTGLREAQVRQILGDLHSAMQFLHLNKITHRDLKPENIVTHVIDHPANNPVTQSNKKVIFKLIDLGYAKEIDSQSVCASFVGTVQYLAPEIMYSKTYSNSVDYWSLGLLAFEIICGIRPFLPFMAPVQWIPHVKKKSHENICVYETFHGDIEYSKEVFPENHISKALQVQLEQWLQVALEFDPKLRGRDFPSKVSFNIPAETNNAGSSSVVIFSLLEQILATKIIKVFSVTTLAHYSYQITSSVTIAELKSWLAKDANIPVTEQVLLSQTTYTDIENGELVDKYWNDDSNYMLFLYSKSNIINDNVEPIVPKSVQRSLEHPKALYNFKNSQTLYRHGMHLVMSQMDIYDGLINGLYTRAESLKHESKQLLLKHNAVDKCIGKLITQEETVTKMIETGKKHIQHMRDTSTATNYLAGFQKIFDDCDELNNKVGKLQLAWNQLSVRLQSAARRSNEVLAVDLNSFVSKHNYHAIFTNAMKTYVSYKRSEHLSEHKSKDKQCHDIIKICYDCLKYRSKILTEMQHQPFILKLKDLNMEFAKISEIISNASGETEKLTAKLSSLTEELTNCTWTTLSILASDAESVGELPYSVVAFRKQDFKIGDTVSKDCMKMSANLINEDENLKSLIQETLKIRQNQQSLSQKLNSQKDLLKQTNFDFSFLKE